MGGREKKKMDEQAMPITKTNTTANEGGARSRPLGTSGGGASLLDHVLERCPHLKLVCLLFGLCLALLVLDSSLGLTTDRVSRAPRLHRYRKHQQA